MPLLETDSPQPLALAPNLLLSVPRNLTTLRTSYKWYHQGFVSTFFNFLKIKKVDIQEEHSALMISLF